MESNQPSSISKLLFFFRYCSFMRQLNLFSFIKLKMLVNVKTLIFNKY